MEVTAHGLLQEWAHKQGYGITITVPGDIYFHYDVFNGFAAIHFGNRPGDSNRVPRSIDGEFRLSVASNPYMRRPYQERMIAYVPAIETTHHLTLADPQVFDKLSATLEIHIMSYIEFTGIKYSWPRQDPVAEFKNILTKTMRQYGQA